MKIFGIGLSKTGTVSLTKAFRLLGYKSIHDIYVVSNVYEYDAAVDTTIAARYKELDIMFPGSKFVLSIRNTDTWIRSYETHKKSIIIESYASVKQFEYHWVRAKLYGVLNPTVEQSIEGYKRHVKDVMEYFSNRPNDLLVLDICGGEGWAKLCPFLGKYLPSVPFPHLNKT